LRCSFDKLKSNKNDGKSTETKAANVTRCGRLVETI